MSFALLHWNGVLQTSDLHHTRQQRLTPMIEQLQERLTSGTGRRLHWYQGGRCMVLQ